MKMFRKGTATLLSLVMVFGVLVSSAVAAPSTEDITASSMTQLINTISGNSGPMTIDLIGTGDTQPPTGGITLNNGASTTTTPYITANLWYYDNTIVVGEMCFSFDGMYFSQWETFTSTKAIVLSGSNGQKNVYVAFRDGSGNVSQIYMATINLTAASSGSSIYNIMTTPDSMGGTTISWQTASPCMSFINVYMAGSQSSTFQPISTGYTTEHSVRVSGTYVGVQYAFVIRCTDANGNTTTSPENRFTGLQVQDTTAPTGTITLNNGASYTTSTTVTATISATDNTNSPIEMSISTNGSTFSAWEPLVTTKQVQVSSGDGTKTVYVRFRDAFGNISRNYTATIAIDTRGPIITNFDVQSSGSSSVRVTWNTDEAATSYVEYYSGSSSSNQSTGSSSYVTSHSIVVNNLSQNSTYNFRVYSIDRAGNKTESSWRSFSMQTQDTTKPTVSNVQSINISTNTATITWTTNKSTTGRVYYGTSSSANQYNSSSNNYTTSHSIQLTGLNSNTTYYYRVQATDSSGNMGESTTYSFRTGSNVVIDTTPPTISNPNVGNITSNSATITWTTNESASGRVYYGTSSNANQYNSSSNSLNTSHSILLTGLNANTTYYYRIQATDSAGNMREAGTYSFSTSSNVIIDNTPPTINNVNITNITSNSATITWTTNESATGRVYYGTSSNANQYNSSSNSWNTSHSIQISGLNANTTYYFRVQATDSSGNMGEAGVYSFGTSSNVIIDNTPPNINNVNVTGISSSGATITWTTNENATGRVYYGTSSNANQYNTSSNSLSTSQSIQLTGLNSNTTYYYRIQATDAAGNMREAGTYSFTTIGATVNPPIVNPPVTEVRNTNVAASRNGGSATASSHLNASAASNYPASNAIDASTTSYWQSNVSPTASQPQWLQVNFNSSYKINTITLSFGGTTAPTDFTVQYLAADGRWVDMVSATGHSGTSWTRTFSLVETTAIRIVVTKAQSSSVGCRILDVDVRYN